MNTNPNTPNPHFVAVDVRHYCDGFDFDTLDGYTYHVPWEQTLIPPDLRVDPRLIKDGHEIGFHNDTWWTQYKVSYLIELAKNHGRVWRTVELTNEQKPTSRLEDRWTQVRVHNKAHPRYISLEEYDQKRRSETAELWSELGDLFDEMNMDERRSLLLLARKMVTGSGKHGHLDLATDKRDWVKEALDEALDLVHYLNFQAQKQVR